MKTSHELAKELLKLPDVPIVTTDGEYGYAEVVTGFTYRNAEKNEQDLIQVAKCIGIESRGGYSG